MKCNKIVTTTMGLALFAVTAMAGEASWRDRMGSNSLSDAPRGENSPPMVRVPPTGMPQDDVSTDDSGGNGMVQRDRFDIYGNETNDLYRHRRQAKRAKRLRGDSATVTTYSQESTVHSASPARENYFAFGDDLPALRGLNTEAALNRLHHINVKEINMAKLAESTAKSADVLNLAHRIRADHQQLEQNVRKVATEKKIALEPFQLATYEQAVYDRLKKLSGADFEAAFLRINELGHQESEHTLRMVRNDLTDTQVRNLINQALPVMAAHMEMPNERARARARAEESGLGQ